MQHPQLMPADVLAAAKAEHQQYLTENPHKRVICDDTITPFFNAMKTLGYSAKTQKNGCSVLRECTNDSCKRLYSELFIKDGIEVWACPHCRQIE